MEIIKPGREFDFMGKRWLFIGLSVTLLILSAISLVYPGPKLGTDFKGGTEIEIAFTQPTSGGEVRAAVEKIGFEAPDVVSVGDFQNPNHFLIRVQEVSALSDARKSRSNSTSVLSARLARRRAASARLASTPPR